jgi:hypothetical protein
MLTNETITFGKYKGFSLDTVLRDRNYCVWLLDQEWFKTNYEFLYNRVLTYDPKIYFLDSSRGDPNDFLDSYIYFNLTPINDLKIELNNVDKSCYEYYIRIIHEIKQKIYDRLENEEENPYAIKAPTKWLKKFEAEYCIQRSDFKEFLSAYELPNITYIIERIKKEGGIIYKGAQSFNIAKERSQTQECWWNEILKKKYGESISSQFKYEKCIFDFLNIETKTIFECKLGLKDFDKSQHFKYKIALKEYRIIYLISIDCAIDMEKNRIYTNNVEKYTTYQQQISSMKNSSYLDKLIIHFNIINIENLEDIFGSH